MATPGGLTADSYESLLSWSAHDAQAVIDGENIWAVPKRVAKTIAVNR